MFHGLRISASVCLDPGTRVLQVPLNTRETKKKKKQKQKRKGHLPAFVPAEALEEGRRNLTACNQIRVKMPVCPFKGSDRVSGNNHLSRVFVAGVFISAGRNDGDTEVRSPPPRSICSPPSVLSPSAVPPRLLSGIIYCPTRRAASNTPSPSPTVPRLGTGLSSEVTLTLARALRFNPIIQDRDWQPAGSRAHDRKCFLP